jgi:hypothetical protein
MATKIVVLVQDSYSKVDPQKILDVMHQILGYKVVPDEKGRLVRVIGDGM